MAYGYIKTVTQDHTKVYATANLTDYVAYIDVTDAQFKTTGNGGRLTNSSGYDLIFTSDSAGTTKLDHKLISYSPTTGRVQALVRIPTLTYASDTVIYAVYGNSAITTSQEAVTGVFRSSYKLAALMSESPDNSAGQIKDLTSSANNGTSTNMNSSNSVAGKLNKAIHHNGSNTKIDFGDIAEFDGATKITYSAWLKYTTLALFGCWLGKWGPATNTGLFFCSDDATPYNDMILDIGNAAIAYKQTASNWLTQGDWHYVTVVYDGSQSTMADRIKIYADGGEKASTVIMGTIPTTFPTTGGGLQTGNRGDGQYYGTFDIELLTINIGETYIAGLHETHYANQNSSSTFFTVGTESELVVSSITLTDVTDGKIVQRNSSNQGSLTITGTYAGGTSIQARIVQDGTSTEVVTWTTIVASPTGGNYSGTLTGIPQGGWYNVQVRLGNDTSVTASGTHKFGVGILIGCIGQSNMEYMLSSGSTVTANSLYRQYNENGWAVVANNGGVSLANKLIAALNIPVGLLDYGVGGTALLQEADTGQGYWLNTAANSPYDKFKTGYTAVGGALEFILWAQGENEAIYGSTKANYQTGMTTFFNRLRSDITSGKGGTLPIIMAQLSNSTAIADANWQAISDAQYSFSQTGTYCAVSTKDIPLADQFHHTAAGYTTMGLRFGQVILYLLGSQTYYHGPQISGYKKLSSTQLQINLVHQGGSDFTPTSGITGFRILDNGSAETITAAVRLSATAIRLTVSGSLDGTLTVQYLYGTAPTVSGIVVDNSAMSLPLEFAASIILAADVAKIDGVAIGSISKINGIAKTLIKKFDRFTIQ